jgi:phosphoribosylamine--glycine ligase
VVDTFQAEGLLIFGPNRQAARLEASKIFTKELLLKYRIPTGAARAFTDPQEAYAYSRQQPYPQVIKADGLAAGKGVVIAQDPDQAAKAIRDMMEKRIFGESGAQVLIEECLFGQEISILALTDGHTFQVLPTAQDHKRLLDQDQGPNTGGMGAYAPAPFYTPELARTIAGQILHPTLEAFRTEGIDYQGVLYVGLMLTADGPKVLEFNVRLGDPETQVILPLLETPLYQIAQAIARRQLSGLTIRYKPLHAVGIVLAAGNYPESPQINEIISGLEQVQKIPHTMVFHGGTKHLDQQVVTAGGRVLTVTGWADQLLTARNLAYQAAAQIQFSGAQYRKDIGARSLAGKEGRP